MKAFPFLILLFAPWFGFSSPLTVLVHDKAEAIHVSSLLQGVEVIEYDLPDILDGDLKEIVRAKLLSALKQEEQKSYIAFATGLSLDALNGLPGPFYPWFQQKIGNEGIYHLVKLYGKRKAEIVTVVGFAESADHIRFFEGRLAGEIVSLRGSQEGGWDPIFQPEGSTKTLAEMDPLQRKTLSPMRFAFESLKAYISLSKDKSAKD